MNALIEELEHRRVDADMSKWELARRLGVSRHTVTRKLSGETQFTVAEAYQACRELGTTLQYVISLLEDRQYEATGSVDVVAALRSAG